MLERDILQSKYDDLMLERDLLQSKYDDFFDYSYNPLYPTVEEACLWLDRMAYSHEPNLFDC